MKRIILGLIALVALNAIISASSYAQVPLNVVGQQTPVANGQFDLGSSTRKWKDIYLSGDAYVGDELIGSDTSLDIRQSTADASDSKGVAVCGGGTCSTSRGAYVDVRGNESSGAGGNLYAISGNVASSILSLFLGSTTSSLKVQNSSGQDIWTVSASDGSVTQDATRGGPITLSKANTYVAQPAGTIAAAGSTQGTATAITTSFVTVTGATGTAGVKLPAAVAGRTVFGLNVAAAILKLYPDTSDAINSGAANASTDLAASTFFVCYAEDAVTWRCLEGAQA